MEIMRRLRFIFRKKPLHVLVLCAWCAGSDAAPNQNGQTGYIDMPSGRIEADGVFRTGYSFDKPYATLWSSLSILPRVEVSARYTRFMNTPAAGTAWQGYGDYKDKVASGRLLLLEEDWNTPALSFGVDDVMGTSLFSSRYMAASKQFGALDATLGIGRGRIDGVFAGARYAPKDWHGFAVAAEYDANNYKQDLFAVKTAVDKRKKGVGVALEYRYGWLGSQLSVRDGQPGLTAYASLPLDDKEFIPKLDEPAPDTEDVPRPTLKQWHDDPVYHRALIERLLQQDFRNIHVRVEQDVVDVTLTNSRISLPSRAIGRAARSVLLRSPKGTRQIVIHYTVNDVAFATYAFNDAKRLQRYFYGLESRKQLAETVSISYAEPQDRSEEEELLDEAEEQYYQTHLDGSDGDMVSFRAENSGLGKIRVAPGVGIYFNDPSGAFRYELLATASVEKQAGDGLILKATTQLTLAQDISGVQQASNSLLPHVRTDVANYKKNGSIKLTQALVNQYFHPEQRIYARASAGLYEEMFGGFGGQVLYYPERGPWAIDLTVDALQQRDVGGGFAFRPYTTTTALAALHYQLPVPGLSATMRAGRFLAGDIGGRFEMKRHFRSGFEAGAWYTLTNGNDITTPGSPAQPYHDKGVFMAIPLDTLLTRDTQARPRLAISPWTRDVGQMVASPGDLYDMMDPGYSNMHDQDGLQFFGDLDDSYEMPARDPNFLDRMRMSNWQEDREHVLNGLTSSDTWIRVGLGVGISALSSVLDKPADKWAVQQQNSSFSKSLANVGNNLPLLVGGVAGLLALDGSDQQRSATAFTALEAGVVGVLASEAGKQLLGRSRPQAGQGNSSFNPLRNSAAGFPSGHTTAIWAMVTPFAREYNMPWLYGAAAITNVGRVASRQHFVSDTVGGSLLGYAVGSSFWAWHHTAQPVISLDGDTLGLNWNIE